MSRFALIYFNHQNIFHIHNIASFNMRHPAPIADNIANMQNANAKWYFKIVGNRSFILAAKTAIEISIKPATKITLRIKM